MLLPLLLLLLLPLLLLLLPLLLLLLLLLLLCLLLLVGRGALRPCTLLPLLPAAIAPMRVAIACAIGLAGAAGAGA